MRVYFAGLEIPPRSVEDIRKKLLNLAPNMTREEVQARNSQLIETNYNDCNYSDESESENENYESDGIDCDNVKIPGVDKYY